jgi:predicted phosphodiesterase
LGKYIVEAKPDNVVMMGDFLSLDSLSAWDKNKRLNLELKRLRAELDAGREAMDRLMNPLLFYNSIRRKTKSAMYKPNLIFLVGNHEDRLHRYYEEDPTMLGIVDMYEEIGAREFGWEIIPYREYWESSGVLFTHVPMNGVNKPISGQRIVDTALQTHPSSIVFGHTHCLKFATVARHGVESVQNYSLNCGWFGEEIPEYAKGSLGSKDWWAGIVMMYHLDDEGKFDFNTISIEELINGYS